MKKQLELTLRFSWMRKISVAILCLYYYLSLFRQASDTLGFDVELATRMILWLFFIIVFMQLLLNLHAVYTIYQRSRFGFVVVLLFVLVFTLLTQQSWLLIPFLLYLSFADNSFRSLAKQLFIFSSICFATVVAIGITLPDVGREVVDKSYSIASIVGIDANSLGFPNSNHPMMYLTMTAINGAFLFTTRKKRQLYSFILFTIATVIFTFTLSLTGYICISIFLGVYAFSSAHSLRTIRATIPIIAILAILLTPWIALSYGHNDGNLINEALSKRPYLWNLRVSDGAYLNIIGNADNFQSKDDEDKSGYTLDNQYLLLITRYGWGTLLIFFYIYFIGIQKIMHPAIISGLLALSIYLIFESIMFILVLCIVPVMMIGHKITSQQKSTLEYIA
jgi:hypothetical protein